MPADTFSLVSGLLHWGVGALLAMAVLFFIVQFVVPGFRWPGSWPELPFYSHCTSVVRSG